MINMEDGLSGNYTTDGTTNMDVLITEGMLVIDDCTQVMDHGRLATMSESEITDVANINMLPAPNQPRTSFKVGKALRL